jgi:hypothetical protein
MISGRMGNNTPFGIFIGKPGHGIVSTSELEGAYSLKIFTFKIDLRPHSLIQGSRVHNGCDMGMTAESLACCLDEFKHVVCIFGHNLAAVFEWILGLKGNSNVAPRN